VEELIRGDGGDNRASMAVDGSITEDTAEEGVGVTSGVLASRTNALAFSSFKTRSSSAVTAPTFQSVAAIRLLFVCWFGFNRKVSFSPA